MPTNNYLPYFTSLIPGCFISSSGALEEDSADMKLPLVTSGASSLILQFDKKLDRTNYPKGLFPFFNRIPAAHSICDYIIFAQVKSNLFCICVELKKGDSQTRPQLKAGACLSRFIIDTINRVNSVSLNVKLRFVSVHDKNLTKKGTTRCEPVKYDRDGYTIFKGSSFVLLEFLS